MSKSNVAGALAAVSVVASTLLFALGNNDGALAILGIATAATSWLIGYQTYNPKLSK